MNRSTKKDDHKAMVPFSDPSLARLGKMVKGAEKGEFFPIFNNASVDFPSDYSLLTHEHRTFFRV